MKRILTLIFSLIILVACKDKDETDLSVEGTWLPVKEVVSGCDNDGANGTVNYDANGCVGKTCRELIFFEEIFMDRITDEGGVVDDSHVYEVEGKKLILYYSNDVVVEVPIDGDNLTITTWDELTGCTAVTTYTRKK
jgi:hypothetical protein